MQSSQQCNNHNNLINKTMKSPHYRHHNNVITTVQSSQQCNHHNSAIKTIMKSPHYGHHNNEITILSSPQQFNHYNNETTTLTSPQQCNHHNSTATTTVQYIHHDSAVITLDIQTAQCHYCLQYPNIPMCVLQEHNDVAQLYNITPFIHV